MSERIRVRGGRASARAYSRLLFRERRRVRAVVRERRLMERSTFRRVEVAFRSSIRAFQAVVPRSALLPRITQAWLLGSDGSCTADAGECAALLRATGIDALAEEASRRDRAGGLR